jgi:hypothetical protein
VRAALIAIAALVALTSARADERLAGVACRSVHLSYPADEAAMFCNEVVIDRSAPGSYFMVCGWSLGYFGLQELANGDKVVLFSVWDPGEQNDPGTVDDDRRVKLLYNDPDVRVRRFGGEGTGGQSFFDLDWQLGQPYRLLVSAEAKDGRSIYTGSIYDAEAKSWRRLVTFSTPSDGELLRGCYSFVEDFRRNRVSATQTREARFGNGWLKPADGPWQPIVKARFTADSNPATNINAGLAAPYFFLATGGDVTNHDARLRSTIEWADAPDRRPPDDLPRE